MSYTVGSSTGVRASISKALSLGSLRWGRHKRASGYRVKIRVAASFIRTALWLSCVILCPNGESCSRIRKREPVWLWSVLMWSTRSAFKLFLVHLIQTCGYSWWCCQPWNCKVDQLRFFQCHFRKDFRSQCQPACLALVARKQAQCTCCTKVQLTAMQYRHEISWSYVPIQAVEIATFYTLQRVIWDQDPRPTNLNQLSPKQLKVRSQEIRGSWTFSP